MDESLNCLWLIFIHYFMFFLDIFKLYLTGMLLCCISHIQKNSAHFSPFFIHIEDERHFQQVFQSSSAKEPFSPGLSFLFSVLQTHSHTANSCRCLLLHFQVPGTKTNWYSRLLSILDTGLSFQLDQLWMSKRQAELIRCPEFIWSWKIS